VKTLHEPKEEKYKRFAKEEKACQKDVARAFALM
jgi:hypothetical protein